MISETLIPRGESTKNGTPKMIRLEMRQKMIGNR